MTSHEEMSVAACAQRLEKMVLDGVEKEWYSCATWRVTGSGATVAEGSVGVTNLRDGAASPAKLDTIFDMASLTKPFTAVLLLHAAERGDLHLGMPLAAFLPEAVGTRAGDLTLRQLATHTSGLSPWKALYERSEASPVPTILSMELAAEPSTRYAYSDLGYILLGEVLARTYQLPLDELLRAWILEPAGLHDTMFNPPAALQPRIAATAHCSWRPGETLIGSVHDANAASMGGVAGHAGIFSTLDDMTRFVAAIMGRGENALLSPAATAVMSTNQIEPAIGGHSIGWFTPPNGMLPGGDFGDHAFGHTGFTGTMLMLTSDGSLTMLLTNYVLSPFEGGEIMRLRRRFANAAAAMRSVADD
ncbi:MAG: beta-lactamase family protein [Armatimonadetes bacterium]|nr:beta-lactamase family protein [Armatimonadota bacterium]MDE2205245.1 beta-lactamase family protein [Armatimonadota bacterium]